MPSNLSHSKDALDSGQTTTNEVPVSDQKKKVLHFEIKSADSTEWARWFLNMSTEDEMRAQMITFILCVVVLENLSELCAVWWSPRCLSWLSFRPFISLCTADLSVKLVTCQNQHLTQDGSVDLSYESSFTSSERMCRRAVWEGEGGVCGWVGGGGQEF